MLLTIPALAGDWRVGVASVRITPSPRVPMAGYYNERKAESIHDDLYAKAMVIEKDGAKAALVACDLISMPRPVVEEARQLIQRTTNLRGEQVMIGATHSHTGPVLSGTGTRDVTQGGLTDAALHYRTLLPTRIAESVRLAAAALTPVKIFVGNGREESLPFNRRYHMKDGTVGWNPGKLNLEIVKPAGPIDPDVPVVYVETTPSKPLVTYVNFAMHLDTVGGLQISADYPCTLSRLLAQIKGPQMLTLFTIGTAGDINHINVNDSTPQKGHAEATRIGTILAGEVLKTFARLKPVEAGALRVKSAVIKLPLADITPQDVEKAGALARRYGGRDEPKFLEKVFAFKVLDVHARHGAPLEAEVQVVALGDEVAWVGLPGEIFAELGLAIKEQSPFPHTIIVELANGAVGYVPTKKAYAEDNYEVVSARCAEGSGEMLVETAVKLLEELKQ
jgi:hypothetical protein